VFAEELLIQSHSVTHCNTLQHAEVTVFAEALLALECRKTCVGKVIPGERYVDMFAVELLFQSHSVTHCNTLQHAEATVIPGEMCVEKVRCVLPCVLLCVLQGVLQGVMLCVIRGEMCVKRVIRGLCSGAMLCGQQEE